MDKKVPRKVAIRSLSDLVGEAYEYARLHDLPFIAVCDVPNKDKFRVHSWLNPDNAHMYVRGVVGMAGKELIEHCLMEEFEEPQEEPAQKVKWSFLWGLIKRYE